MRNSLKAVLLACSALVTTPAAAQAVLSAPPPTEYILDERGVDVLAGTFNLSSTDLVIGPPGQGGMTYNRVFAGTGWRDNLMSAVEKVSSGPYIVSIGGYSEAFTGNGSTFTPVIPQGSKLVRTSTNVLTWTWADGTIVVFDTLLSTGFSPVGGNFGRAISITSPDGERTTLQYEQVVIEDTAPIQRAVRLSYAENNHGYRLVLDYEMMSSPTLPEQFGEWTRITGVYGINRAEDLCNESGDCYPSVPRPYVSYVTGSDNSTSTTTDAVGNVTRYEYFDAGRRMTGIRLPGSTVNDVNISYASNRVASVQTGTDTWSYAYSDSAGVRTTTITDPLSGVTTAQSNITARQLTNWSDPLGNAMSYFYNAGRLSRSVLPNGQSVDYTLDGRGNVTQTQWQPASGSSLPVINTYATFPATCTNVVTCNRPLTTTDERGGVTDYSWDASHGGLLSVTEPAPVSGAVRPQTRVTYGPRYAWVRTGSTTFGAMATPVTVPLTTSQCVTTASCSGAADEIRTTIDYGATGTGNNVLPVLITTGSGNGALTASNTVTYSGNGDVIAVNGPLSGTDDTTHFRYDRVHRPVGAIGPDPDGAGPLKRRALRMTYNPRSQVELAEQGTVDGLTDPNWAAFASLQQVATGYDTRGRPVSARVNAGGTTYSLSQQSYDGLSRVDCVVTRMNPATFASPPASACTAATIGTSGPDRITRHGYDAASRLISSTSGFGVDPIVESATYNVNSQPLTLTDGNGNVSTMVYDGYGRLNRMRYPNATGGGSSTTDYEEYGYDPASNVVSLRNRAGQTLAATYDALDRQLTLTGPSLNARSYVYDNLGRMTASSIATSGPNITRAYDALSRLTSETQGTLGAVAYQYDLAGRRTRITWPDAFYAQYDWNPGDDLTAIRENGASSGAGVLAAFTYDNLGHRTNVTRGNGTTSAWGYDPVSRLTSLSHDLAGTADDLTLTFAYNPANQIISRTMSNVSYAYAPTTGTTTSVNNGRNQVTSVGGTSVTYDGGVLPGNGNITSVLGNTYGYNALSQLTSATPSGGGATALTYDPANRLHQTGSGGTATRFQYAGDQLAAEYNASGLLTRRHVPGFGLDQLAAGYDGTGTSNRSWPLADERGSVIALTGGTGVASVVNTYDEYGVPAAGNAGRFQYTGQVWLTEAALYHYRARAYLPQIGRFLQTDPIGYAAGPNLYVYVGADPVNLIDPFGLNELPPVVVDGPRVYCPRGWSCWAGADQIQAFLDSVAELDTVEVQGRRPSVTGGALAGLAQIIRNACPVIEAEGKLGAVIEVQGRGGIASASGAVDLGSIRGRIGWNARDGRTGGWFFGQRAALQGSVGVPRTPYGFALGGEWGREVPLPRTGRPIPAPTVSRDDFVGVGLGGGAIFAPSIKVGIDPNGCG